MTPPPHSVFGLEFGFWGGKPRGTRKTGPGDRIRGPDPGPGARGARDPENRVFGPKIGPKTGPGPGPRTRFWDRFWTGLGPVLDRFGTGFGTENRVQNGSENGSETGPKTGPKSPPGRIPRQTGNPQKSQFCGISRFGGLLVPCQTGRKKPLFSSLPPKTGFFKDRLWGRGCPVGISSRGSDPTPVADRAKSSGPGIFYLASSDG